MKALVSVLSTFVSNRSSRSNLRTLLRFVAILVALITFYSLMFHVLMENEGQKHSWITGFYWTLTVMTTLGFGDITFISDSGRLFSIVVLVTGVLFMLVILPFTFIEFFYAPWMQAQAKLRAPRELPQQMRRHVILTNYDAVTASLIPMLERYDHPYVVLLSNTAAALELHDKGVKVAVGDVDDPETYRKMRLERAAMLVANRDDTLNTNTTFSAREYAPKVTILAMAHNNTAMDMLELAGATAVLRPYDTMAKALARRVLGNDRAAHVIGEANELLIAEAMVAGTPFEGKTLAQSGIREQTGFSVIGYWNHGKLVASTHDMVLSRQTVLIGAGTRAQIDAYNATFGLVSPSGCHVIVVGAGRVGRQTAEILRDSGHDPVIIERMPDLAKGLDNVVVGDATEMETLKSARAREATSVILTSHEDDTNIALTIFFRRLRNHFQIISRCSLDRNVHTLHRAGADLVLSSATMGANEIFNRLRDTDNLLLAEGVTLFPSPVPDGLVGRRIADCAVRSQTGCTIIAVENDGERVVNPTPNHVLPKNGTLWLMGTLAGEEAYLREFKPELTPHTLLRRWKKEQRKSAK